MIECPCKGCTDRKIGCHGWCDRYKAFAVEQQSQNASIRKQKEALSQYLDMKQNVVEKAMRKRKCGR